MKRIIRKVGDKTFVINTPSVEEEITPFTSVWFSSGGADVSPVPDVTDVSMLLRIGKAGSTIEDTDTPDATTLDEETLGSLGSWSVPNSLATHATYSDDEELTVNGLAVSGTGTPDDYSPGLSLKFGWAQNQRFARFILDAEQPKISVGFAMKLTGFDGSLFEQYDPFCVEAGGEFAAISFKNWPGTDFSLSIHTLTGTGVYQQIAVDTWYWVTVLYDRGDGNAYLKVYNASTWALVVDDVCPFAIEQSVDTVCIGRYDAHVGAPADCNFYYDDLCIDATGAAWPLLPSEATP